MASTERIVPSSGDSLLPKAARGIEAGLGQDAERIASASAEEVQAGLQPTNKALEGLLAILDEGEEGSNSGSEQPSPEGVH